MDGIIMMQRKAFVRIKNPICVRYQKKVRYLKFYKIGFLHFVRSMVYGHIHGEGRI